MAKINILSPFIFNRIAAGEVVEKPCSAVKELVENSIDAGAKNIIISIEKGGLQKIEITDDGCGIEFDDLKNALISHATSKIKEVDDLDNIATLGFRGEALASIASISEIEIVSKTSDCDYAGKICCDYGVIKPATQIGSANGTRIKVQNLFHNVPARLKFMRKEKTEENDITNYISRLILANPGISFTYTADGKTIFSHKSSDLKTAIADIYGYETQNNIVEVNQTKDGMTIFGYIGRPELSKANRTYQTLIINGRYVINYMISSAISNVYDDFLMKGKFPFYVLCLDMPTDKIDVNVHPNKLEVKFDNYNEIFTLFNHACFTALNNTNFTTIAEQNQTKNNTEISEEIKQPKVSFSMEEGTSFSLEKQTKPVEFESKTSLLSEIILTQTNPDIKQEIKQDILFEVDSPAKYLCCLFDTYILIQKGDDIFLIDQHAAHERLNYDKLQHSIKAGEPLGQKLIIPYNLSLNNQEDNFFQNNREILSEIGFNIEDYGDKCYRINQIPYVLSGENLKDYFDDIFKNLNSFINKPLNFIKDSLCQRACKSSIKGGNKLSENEISYLVKELKDKNATLLCPHGRPIIVKLTKTEIEKWFKRIV